MERTSGEHACIRAQFNVFFSVVVNVSVVVQERHGPSFALEPVASDWRHAIGSRFSSGLHRFFIWLARTADGSRLQYFKMQNMAIVDWRQQSVVLPNVAIVPLLQRRVWRLQSLLANPSPWVTTAKTNASARWSSLS